MVAQLVSPPGGGGAGNAIEDLPIVYVNGRRNVLPLGRAEATLLQWLRGEIHFQVITCAFHVWLVHTAHEVQNQG